MNAYINCKSRKFRGLNMTGKERENDWDGVRFYGMNCG